MKLSFFFLIPLIAFAQISPTNPIVQIGHNITITASSVITCPSTGYVGSYAGCGTTSVTYTAPSSIVPKITKHGVQLVPNNSIWVTPINNLPIDSASATKMTNLNPTNTIHIDNDYSWGIGLVTSAFQSFTPIPYYSSSTSYGLFPDPQLSQFYAMTEQSGLDGITGYYVGGNNADHHTVMIDNANIIRTDTFCCHVYEYYDKYLNTTLRTTNGGTGFTSNVTGAQDFTTTSYALANGNINAGGTLISPLTLTLDDMENGVTHMLSFTACTGCIDFSANNWPATGNNGAGSGTPCNIPANCLVYGDVIHIKNSVLSSLISSTCTGSFITQCTNILNGLNTYGMMMVDRGITGQINIEPRVSVDAKNVSAIAALASILLNSTNFEKVNTQSLEVSATSSEVCPINQTCASGVQSYVTPSSDAWVSVSGIIYPISIQGVGISLDKNYPNFIPIIDSSQYSVTLPMKITGTTNLGINWSIVSGVGTVSAGVYTLPSTAVTTPTTTIIKAVSQADTNVSTLITLNVVPATTPNLIQDDSSSTSNTFDFYGNTWLADLGTESTYYLNNISGYSTNQTPYATQFNTGMNYFGVVRKYYFLPNGNYSVSFLLGQGQCSPSWSCGSWLNQYNSIYNLLPIAVEVNGQTQLHQYDWSKGTSYLYAQGNLVTVPATVTNNFLELGLYKVAPDITESALTSQCTGCININYAPPSQNDFIMYNGLLVATDSTSAYLGIDVGNVQSSITSGGKFQVWPIDGHINLPLGVGTVSWSLLNPIPSGATIVPNSFDNGAIITLPSGSYRNSDLINVQSTYGGYTAVKSIPISGGSSPLMQLH